MLAKTSFGYTQVAKQMVMTLGMSPEIGQRLLGGQQGGGPFMGRAFGSVSNFFFGPRKIGWKISSSHLTQGIFFIYGWFFCDQYERKQLKERHLSKSLIRLTDQNPPNILWDVFLNTAAIQEVVGSVIIWRYFEQHAGGFYGVDICKYLLKWTILHSTIS